MLSLSVQGTLFLDEVGELSQASQVKLLRVLEEGEYRPVGGTTAKQADVRILAATNRPLIEMVKDNTFREDLFYRLHIMDILIPPLRQRIEDIPVLIEYFLEHFAKDENTQRTIPNDVYAQLRAYQWPGNIRELQHVLCRYVTTHRLSFTHPPNDGGETPDLLNNEQPGKSLKDSLELYEQQMITQALMSCQGDREKTAVILGIPPRTLRTKIRKYQIIGPYQRTLQKS